MDVVHRPPDRRVRDAGPGVRDRTLDDLRYIRRCVEEARSFTAVPGTGMVLVGLSALAMAGFTAGRTGLEWALLWLAEAGFAFALGVGFLVRKSRRAGVALQSGPGRRFGLSLIPSLLCGALLTFVLIRAEAFDALPGAWLVLYGAGVATGGAFSVRSVSAMGISFMLVGAGAVLIPGIPGTVSMAAGFGLLHLAFGLWIRRWHGG